MMNLYASRHRGGGSVEDEMTKHVYAGPVAFEGLPTGDGRLIACGALDWDLPLPVYGQDRRLLGLLTALRREDADDTFALVADVVLEVPMDCVVPCGIEVVDATEVSVGAHVEFTRGRVRALVIYDEGNAPAWPAARLTRIEA